MPVGINLAPVSVDLEMPDIDPKFWSGAKNETDAVKLRGGSLGEVWWAKFGDNHKVRLGKKRSKTNGVKLSKMASNLWVSLGAMSSLT